MIKKTSDNPPSVIPADAIESSRRLKSEAGYFVVVDIKTLDCEGIQSRDHYVAMFITETDKTTVREYLGKHSTDLKARQWAKHNQII